MGDVSRATVKYRNLDRKTQVVTEDIKKSLNRTIDYVNGIGFTGTVHVENRAPKNHEGVNGDLWIQI